MSLDFYRLDNKEHLFKLDDKSIDSIKEIFETYTHWTGLVIDEFGNSNITTENQQTLITIIDKYLDSTDLNRDKLKTSLILEFKGLLKYFYTKNIDLKLQGE